MIRRPPRSTPFPTRRSSDLIDGERLAAQRLYDEVRHDTAIVGTHARAIRVEDPDDPRVELVEAMIRRSEEHTSELQSPCNLVCRLLLEKKKRDNVEIRVATH